MARPKGGRPASCLTVEPLPPGTNGRERSTIELLKDARARAALVRDIMATITERGADGVNLDFEPLPRVVRKQFTALVRELRAAMNAVDPTLQLTLRG